MTDENGIITLDLTEGETAVLISAQGEAPDLRIAPVATEGEAAFGL